MAEILLQIQGLRCQSCVKRVEQTLSALPEVEQVVVNYASETAKITSPNPQPDAWVAAIIRAGYGAQVKTDEVAAVSYRLPVSLWILLLLWLPFGVGMVGMSFGSHALMLPEKMQLVLAWVVQSAFGLPFYRGAWAALKAKTANMDTLVALGTTITLLYSTWAFWGGIDAPYFEASVMVLALIRLGKHFEQQTKQSSLNALSALLKLRPKQVYRVENQSALPMDLGAVRVGDVLRVRAGERIGADGVVLSGGGKVDESHLTGEPDLLSKTQGDWVLSGALVVEGALDFRVNRLGRQTMLGDLLHALELAQNSRAPIAQLADKVASWFVPLVMGLAVLTLIFTRGQSAWVNMAAVFLVACPCALGLATPAGLMAGLGVAVKHGVWFKDGAALESAAAVDTVVLDKTGTLTEGRMQVVQMWLAPSIQSALPSSQSPDNQSALTRETLLQYAASLEIHAKHPVAGALLAYAQCEQLLPVQQLHTETGAGISGVIAGQAVKLGTVDFVQSALPPEVDFSGQSVVVMTVDQALCAVFGLADKPKDDARAAVQALQNMGVRVAILSGDRQSAVVSVAQALGIDEALGEHNPRQKEQAIKALSANGRRVMMVGDGVNDVAAIAASDCGAAFYSGAEASAAVSAVRLMRHDVRQVWLAVSVARQTLRHIRQNLALALLYNGVMLPLAMLGYLTPALAGASMALSSLLVVGNALRLKRLSFPTLVF